MIAIICILSVLLTASLVGNILVLRKALTINDKLIAGGEIIEECLDTIDSSYKNVGRILQLPLASNDSKVVQIHKELKRVHDNLLSVANRLVSTWNPEEAQKAIDLGQ